VERLIVRGKFKISANTTEPSIRQWPVSIGCLPRTGWLSSHGLAWVEQIQQALIAGLGIRATAREIGASTISVMRIAQGDHD
jgi:hypothetical protein